MKEKLQKLKQDKNLIRVIYIIGIIGITDRLTIEMEIISLLLVIALKYLLIG